MTNFVADAAAFAAIKVRLEWAARQKLIRQFTCTPLSLDAAHAITIDWWDPVEHPRAFTRAHDKRGTGSTLISELPT
jgi:hypothetical protein